MSKRTSAGCSIPSNSRDILGHFLGTFNHEPTIDEGHKPELAYEDQYDKYHRDYRYPIRQSEQWRYRYNPPLQRLLATKLIRLRSDESKASAIDNLLTSLERLGFDFDASRAVFRDFREALHCVRCHWDYDPREATADSCYVQHDYCKRRIRPGMPSVEGPCNFEYFCCNLKYGGPEPRFLDPMTPDPGFCFRGSHTAAIEDVRRPYNDYAGRKCKRDGCRPVAEKLPDTQLELMDVDTKVCESTTQSDDDGEDEESEGEGFEEDEDEDDETTTGISACVLAGLDDSSSDSDDSDYWSDESAEDIDPKEEDDKKEWVDEVDGLMEERAENGASDRDLEEFKAAEEDEEEEKEERSADGCDDHAMDVSEAKPQSLPQEPAVCIHRFEPFRVPTARDILKHYFGNQGSDSFHTSISAVLRQEIHQVDVGAVSLLLRSLESIGIKFKPSRRWILESKHLFCARCNEDFDPRRNGPTSCAQKHHGQPEIEKFKSSSRYGTHAWRYPCCARVMYGSEDGPNGDYKDPDFCFVSWHTTDESRVPWALRRAIERGPRPHDLVAYRLGHYNDPVGMVSTDVDVNMDAQGEEEFVPERLFKRLRIE